MKDLFLPLEIGEDYEKYEWNLEILICEDIPMCDKYLWVGAKVNKIFNLKPSLTKVIFYWDRLEVVIHEFDNKHRTAYNKLNDNLSKNFSTLSNENLKDDIIINKFFMGKINYWSLYLPSTNQIKLISFSNSFPYTNNLIGSILKI